MEKKAVYRKLAELSGWCLAAALSAGLVVGYPSAVALAETAQVPVRLETEGTPEPPEDEEPTPPPEDDDDDPEKVYHQVSVRVSGEGYAWADRTKVQAGERVTVTARASEGWKFSRFEGCGESGIFFMPAADVVIIAVFEKEGPGETPEPSGEDPTPEPSDEGDSTPEPPKDTSTPEPEDGGEPERPAVPEPVKRKFRLWIPFAAAGAAAGAGSAWYFFVFGRRRKFHGIFAEESIPGTREWGERNPEQRESWFIPILLERLNCGEITWEEYTDTLMHCGVGTMFPGDTKVTVIPLDEDIVYERASERRLFERLSCLSGPVEVRFTSRRTGMDFMLDIRKP